MQSTRMFIAPVILLLLMCNSVKPTRASLSAFSETRSFRDALEGRSMEDAISGPVDKDTSSYGDLAAASASPSAGSPSSSMHSSSTMLNIPANGNMMGYANQQPQQLQPTSQTDEQTKSMNDQGELERGAGPISADQTPVEGEQQMMEQRAGHQQARPNGGRPTMRSGRQQQQPLQGQQAQYPSSGAESPSFGDSGGFGDEQHQTGSKQAKDAQQSTYEQKQLQQQVIVGPEEQQIPTMAPDVQQQQQQQMMTDQADQGQKSSQGGQEQQMRPMQVLAKKRAMAAKLNTMSNGMKYSRATGGPSGMQMGPMVQSSHGEAENNMVQSPMTSMAMSMANKAAYMGQQRQKQRHQYQRQTALPLTGQMDAKMNQMQSANGYGASRMAGASNSGNPMISSAPLMVTMQGMLNGNRMHANMRRANQHKLEKMSPAMVNAMLNKMTSSKQLAGELQPSGHSGAPAAGDGKFSADADGGANRPMKGVSMMANLMMPQMSSSMDGMPAGKREQYRRMLMAAMMQQMQQSEVSSPGDYAQDQRTQTPMWYGERSNKDSMLPANMVNAYEGTQQPMMSARKYNKKSMDTAKTPMPTGREYESQQQQQQQVEAPTALGMEQQKQMGSMVGNYGSPMMERQREMGPTKYMDLETAMQMPTQMPTQMAMQMPNTMSMDSARAYGSSSMVPMMNSAGKMVALTPSKSYGGMADDGNQQQRQQMMMGDGYSDMELQQMEVMSTMIPPMATNGGAKKTQTGQLYGGEGQSSVSKGAVSPKSSMEGFRQVYSQSPMQANGYPSTTPASTMGAPSGPLRGYGMQKQQQMNQESDTQDKQGDDYGQAPVGQAEPFAFDYKIDDEDGNSQYRREKSDENGVVRGSYGYKDTGGIYRHVEYVADVNGFRAKIKSNEPGLSSEPAKTAGQSAARQPMSPMDAAGQAQMAVMQQRTMMSTARMPHQQQHMLPTQRQANSEGVEKKSK